MAMRMKIPAYAAIPALIAVAAGAWLARPAEFRRDPATEALGLIGAASKYEALYTNCADGTDAASGDLKSFAKGFVGGYAHRFPATDDADAAAFARAARPQCALSTLYRLERRWPRRSNSSSRYRRVSVEL